MPRKLLRVALIAAVFPALTPELVSAQTSQVITRGSTIASAPSRSPGPTGWIQRLRGSKPVAADARPATGLGHDPVPRKAAPIGNSRPINAQERSAKIVQVAAQQAEQVIAPPSTDLGSPFPDDNLIRRRRRVEPQVATPIEPEAYPIEAAGPPADVTAEFKTHQGIVPQYDRAGLITPEASATDVSFANQTPARPSGQILNGMNGGVPASQIPPAVIQGAPGMARVDGALYPSPQPGIPFHVGSTMITNPAFDPHEMLYAHRYRGLYGPFYHKTCRHWVLTPFGICKSEKRILMGTEVRVNYKSHISPFALFWPPVSN